MAPHHPFFIKKRQRYTYMTYSDVVQLNEKVSLSLVHTYIYLYITPSQQFTIFCMYIHNRLNYNNQLKRKEKKK